MKLINRRKVVGRLRFSLSTITNWGLHFTCVTLIRVTILVDCQVFGPFSRLSNIRVCKFKSECCQGTSNAETFWEHNCNSGIRVGILEYQQQFWMQQWNVPFILLLPFVFLLCLECFPYSTDKFVVVSKCF